MNLKDTRIMNLPNKIFILGFCLLTIVYSIHAAEHTHFKENDTQIQKRENDEPAEQQLNPKRRKLAETKDDTKIEETLQKITNDNRDKKLERVERSPEQEKSKKRKESPTNLKEPNTKKPRKNLIDGLLSSKNDASHANIAATSHSIVSCNSSEFDLRNYICTDNSPRDYTLALLDKSMVVCGLEDDNVFKELRSFIHASVQSNRKSSLIARSFLEGNGCPEHFIVELKRRKATSRSAILTKTLLKEDEQGSSDKNDILNGDRDIIPPFSESSTNEDKDKVTFSSHSEGRGNGDEDESESEELEYAASMVLFPVTNEPDKMLAYLLGSWPSLLNTTSVIPSFGLKVVTSLGVASVNGH